MIVIQAPPPPLQPRPIGLAAGQFVVPDDFDAPLPDDILDEFEGVAAQENKVTEVRGSVL